MTSLPPLLDLLEAKKSRKEEFKSFFMNSPDYKTFYNQELREVETYISDNFHNLEIEDKKLSSDVNFLIKAHLLSITVPIFLVGSYDMYFQPTWSRLKKFTILPIIFLVFPAIEISRCFELKKRLNLYLLQKYRANAISNSFNPSPPLSLPSTIGSTPNPP